MYLVTFWLILICCYAWSIENVENVENNLLAEETHGRFVRSILNIFENFFKKLRSILQNGDDKIGIPVLDPYIGNNLPITLNIFDEIKVNASLDLRVDGLSTFEVNNADFNLLNRQFDIDLRWPLINANANYSMKGSVFGSEFVRDGEMAMAAHDFELTLRGNFNFDLSKNPIIQITSISTKFSLAALDFHITGLSNNDEELSKTISEMVLKLINENQGFVNNRDIIVKIINKIIGRYLSTMDLPDLLDILI
ncbi:uncharacterized protein LOC105834475 [Monomorium pharaonis]|uniref:uncharacterized protein LOC105834475 n=1 Tax=Monomorium pharaonis TaxID=307658 RepID=UPI00063F6D09|nr:uncharacterized protein LOC105834475 [Monomorium pharaonis]